MAQLGGYSADRLSELVVAPGRAALTDIVPATIGFTGVDTGTTYATPLARILGANGFVYAGDPLYGVAANGTTDDTAAWTAALAAAANVGGWVIAPVGVSMVSSLTVPAGVGILGRVPGGYSSSVGFPAMGSVIKASGTANQATVSLGQFSQLSNMTVQGATGQPVVAVTAGYVDITDCTLFGGSVGVQFSQAGTASRVTRARIYGNATAGINGAYNVTIDACTIDNNGNGIAIINGGNGVRIVGGTRIEYNSGYGITADGTGGSLRDLVIAGASLDSNGSASLLLRLVNNSAITGCSLARGAQGQGSTPGAANDTSLYLQSCSGVTFVGNVTRTGLPDSGSGYNSPYWAVYDGSSNTNCVIACNSMAFHNNSTGSTSGPINTGATFNLASALNSTYWS